MGVLYALPAVSRPYHGRKTTVVRAYHCTIHISKCRHILKINISECIPGYFGPNCTLPCRFPNYGLLCQKACTCNETDCNHRTGCPSPTVGSVSNDMSMKRNRKYRYGIGSNCLSKSSIARKISYYYNKSTL